MLTSHSLKDPERNGFHCAILFWFPLVSPTNKELHEAKGKSFMTVCNQPFVEGSLRLKGGSTGFVNRGDNESTGPVGSAQNETIEKIPSNTHRLCMPVEYPSMEALRNLIFASEPQIREVSKGLRRTCNIQAQLYHYSWLF